MKQLKHILFLVLSLSLTVGFSQDKKVIDYQAFDGWKTLKSEQISPSGKWITYEVQPHKGDTYLYWYNTQTNVLDSVYRGKQAQFSCDERFLIYVIEAGYDTLRKVELDKVDKKKWPKDSLAIYDLEAKKVVKLANVKSPKIGEHHDWLTYFEHENELTEEKNKKAPAEAPVAKKTKSKKGEPAPKPTKKKNDKSEGKVLRLRNLHDGSVLAFKNVMDYELSEDGKKLVYVTHLGDSTRVNVVDLTNFSHNLIEKNFKGVAALSLDKKGEKLAFLGSQDTTKTKVFELYKYDFNDGVLTCLVDTTSQGIHKGLTVSKNMTPRFSTLNDRLFFGVYTTPIPEKKDSLLENEKPKFDLWHYNEDVLQTQQIAGLKRELSKSYVYAYDFTEGKIIALENDTLKLQSNYYEQKEFALARNSRPYEKQSMWDISGKDDYYLMNLQNGQSTLIKKGLTYTVPLSRKGDKLVYFNHENGQYYAIDISSKVETCLTCNAKGKDFTEDRNGMPMDLSNLGTNGWNKEGTQVFINEKNDFYAYDFSSNQLLNLTEDIGAKNNIEFSARVWNRDSTYATLDNFYLIGLDKKTKGSHIYFFEDGKPVKKGYWDAKVSSINKAKDASLFTVRKQTVTEYPDVHIWSVDANELKQISKANPQQSEYNWATVELIDWKSYKGLHLQGLVYKPENFDANKSYPLLVYFYELYSDDLHNHYTPRPTASIIFPTEYASGDYIVFIPDIRYEPGYPARGAYDCIMSGTDAVLKKYKNIDSTRMGLQGQSWGGYQTAQLITMTTRYKAAMAGAPVGNMFSAFGGIRWGTGMSRQFQYEKTQSRIGKTIWDAPELYIENSPIFHLPKVKTPLLLMHNDADGAVPWYQGIEIFTGMRRLGLPCWLLNYNGDDHNLMKTANRRDLSIRMRQFFDHYLQGAPAPIWLKEGIPAIKKGVELRYELD